MISLYTDPTYKLNFEMRSYKKEKEANLRTLALIDVEHEK